MNIRAKMICEHVSVHPDEHSPNETIKLRAVYGDSEENKSFSKWTPSAYVEMNVTNPAAFGAFVEGQEYYVNFTPAAPASVGPADVPQPVAETKALRRDISRLAAASPGSAPNPYPHSKDPTSPIIDKTAEEAVQVVPAVPAAGQSDAATTEQAAS